MEKVVYHLAASKPSDWSPLTPAEVIANLQEQISRIRQNREIDQDLLLLEFAPTSTIQELSMTNAWSNEYLRLSAKFDALIR
ncbi:MAG: hypothetical protein AAGB22_07690 [Bacteroidota bacterium]